MGGWLYRWLYADFWGPVWPNLAAAGLCAPWAVSWFRRWLAGHQAHSERLARIERRLEGLQDERDVG